MNDALLLVCAACSIGSPGFLISSLFLCGPIACFLLLKPYALKATKKWGLPRFSISDFASLFLLQIWPLMLASSAVDHLPQNRTMVATMLLIVCMTFIWYRCLWLLQQNGVKEFLKRTVFTAALLPMMLLLGAACGYWGLSMLLGLTIGSIGLMVVQTIVCCVLAIPLYFGVKAGLKYVFKQDSCSPDCTASG